VSEARYEFRVWGESLQEQASRIRSSSGLLQTRETAETYLVPLAPAPANPKLRASRLDVKVLRARSGGFEQWTVGFKAAFPVEAPLLMSEFFPLLGLPAPNLLRDRYDPSQLLGEVVAAHPGLAAVEVRKVRNSYEVNSCIAEIAAVNLLGRAYETIAIESVDLGVLADTRRALALEGDHNVSYPEFMRGLMLWFPAGGAARG
jgi:hypothetical protein